MNVTLKCQFCLRDFKSAYKLIPHVYIGHRKKIIRQVRDQRAICLKCPATGCDFSHSTPVEDSRPEIIFSTLAEMFLTVEDHIVTLHTKEDKLVECPYCSQELTNCVYWVHLEQHMNSTSSSPATPVSRPVSASSKTPESPKVAPPASEAPRISPPDSEQPEKEDVQSSPSPSKSIQSKSTNMPGLKVVENVAKESNVEEKRKQILKDIEEINKKIALKLKEEKETKTTVMESDLNDLKVKSPTNDSLEEMVASDKKENIREEESITTSSDIQMKVEKHIEENILQNVKIKDESVEDKVKERALVEVEVTLTNPEIKEERKKVTAKEDNEEKSETLKPRSRELSGENDAGNRRRSISGEKRRTRTSVWNKDQQNSPAIKIQGITTVEAKSKPVLTEEMERSIIYGNFKMKDPASRDEKRVDVRREIENRFKEEEKEKEMKRRRLNEEKRKAEEKEREKFRIAEERLRKEREKNKEEKKRNKQRRKESKEDTEAELEEATFTESVEIEAEDDSHQQLSSASSPVRSRSRSPDQYQKIQFEISKMFRESEAGARAEKRPLERDSQSPEAVMTKIARIVPPPVVSYKVEEEEEDDELEIMMREFQERQTTSTHQMKPKEKSLTTASLSLIQSSYNSEIKEDPAPSSAFDDTENSPEASPMISLSLSCNLCKEEDGSSAAYKSAYQLLAHVFHVHRRKIVSEARKSGELSLTCPELCGFVSPASSEGKSTVYFNSQLAVQLSSLCDHLRAHHTGEDRLLHCPDCGLALEEGQVGSWQHLANHTDSRRLYCRVCNNFPFRNEKHRCNVQPEGENDVSSSHSDLEQLEREIVTPRLPRVCGDCEEFYEQSKCCFNQTNLTGSGINHEQTEEILRQDVETFVSRSQVSVYYIVFNKTYDCIYNYQHRRETIRPEAMRRS